MMQVRDEEQLETALCIRRVDPTTFRTYRVVASNHLRTSTLPVAVLNSAYQNILYNSVKLLERRIQYITIYKH